MKTLKYLFVKLLYLTPIGYLLRLMTLYSGDATPGVYVHLPEKVEMKVYVKSNPVFQDKFNWLLNGGFLIVQGLFITFNKIGGDLGAAYSWLSFVFGFVSFVSAICPTFNWNARLKIIRLSYIELVVIIFLIITVVAPDIIRLLLTW